MWFIPTCAGFTNGSSMTGIPTTVHPHIRGVYASKFQQNVVHRRFIPTCVGFTTLPASFLVDFLVHPHVRGVYTVKAFPVIRYHGPSPRTWGLFPAPPESLFVRAVHPHVRGVYTEIKSKISRVSSKTSFLPAEKFKILFLVKIKSSAAAFQVHTIFRDQSPPGLHFEIALHL